MLEKWQKMQMRGSESFVMPLLKLRRSYESDRARENEQTSTNFVMGLFGCCSVVFVFWLN